VLYLAINDEPVLAVFAENSPVPLTAKEVASLTPTDPEIGQVYTWASSGWPSSDPGGVLSHSVRVVCFGVRELLFPLL